MTGKFLLSLFFVVVILGSLKAGVDICLPYRTSALLPMIGHRDSTLCLFLTEWDQSARLSRAQIFETLTVKLSDIERTAMDPTKVGLADPFIFWKIIPILPLILESVPETPGATMKLIVFGTALLILFMLVFYYIVAVAKLFSSASLRSKQKDRNTIESEKIAMLMGRGQFKGQELDDD
jgi:hypothetical protein